jgi:hypothetical protein
VFADHSNSISDIYTYNSFKIIKNNKLKYAQDYDFEINFLRRFDSPSGHYQVNYYLKDINFVRKHFENL